MELILETFTDWDKEVLNRLTPIYTQAILHGAKPEGILRNMVEKKIAWLHAFRVDNGDLAGMAVTGLRDTVKGPILLIDYLAVGEECRGRGYGKAFFAAIRDSAVDRHRISAVIIEAEADDTPDNASRLRFWEGCGFIPTSYVHQYVWVPEPYRALYLPLDPDYRITDDGRSLFREITDFHRLSFNRS